MQTRQRGIRAPFLGSQFNALTQAPDGLPLLAAAVPTYTSHDLFGAVNEVAILHRGERYSLRITSQGKLILTK